MKLLLGMPSPRNIERIKASWDKIEEDYIIVKHFKEWTAYQKIRNYFLENKEYTHLAICPDDLLITQKDINILKKDIYTYNFPVICGICNVEPEDEYLAICESMPIIGEHKFNFMKRKDIKDVIFRVDHAGFPLQIIRRDIVEKFDFDSESSIIGSDPDAIGNLDLMFSHKCKENNIPIMIDSRADMLHLRRSGIPIFDDPKVRYIEYKRGDLHNFLSGPNGDQKTC